MCVKSPSTGQASILVNGSRYGYSAGRAMAFDDSFEHEVENVAADVDRVVLLVQVLTFLQTSIVLIAATPRTGISPLTFHLMESLTSHLSPHLPPYLPPHLCSTTIMYLCGSPSCESMANRCDFRSVQPPRVPGRGRLRAARRWRRRI